MCDVVVVLLTTTLLLSLSLACRAATRRVAAHPTRVLLVVRKPRARRHRRSTPNTHTCISGVGWKGGSAAHALKTPQEGLGPGQCVSLVRRCGWWSLIRMLVRGPRAIVASCFFCMHCSGGRPRPMASTAGSISLDVWTVVYSMLAPAAQAALRAASRRYFAAFALAVAYRHVGFAVGIAQRDDADIRWAPAALHNRLWRYKQHVSHASLVPALLARDTDTSNRYRLTAASLGDNCLAGCPYLECVEVGPAPRTTRVGRFFLQGCPAMQHVAFHEVAAVREIGDGWLQGATALRDIDFSAFAGLECVGDNWMAGCASVRCPALEGLAALTSVGNSWLHKATSLDTFRLTGLVRLREIGAYWLYGAAALRTLDFAGALALERVGEVACCDLDALESLSLTGLPRLERVGDLAFNHLPALKNATFSALPALTRIGGWLQGCPALASVVIVQVPLAACPAAFLLGSGKATVAVADAPAVDASLPHWFPRGCVPAD